KFGTSDMNDNTNDAPLNTESAGAAEPAEEKLARLEAELGESKDRLLRAFAKDLLNVADNLRRALDSAPAEQAADERTRNLLQGVAATERELLAAFERHGIRRIDPVGERFDHNLHQAIFEVENTGQPAGTVVQVLQPGYVMHDRLLRPAMVGVAKGEAKPAADGPHIDEVV